MRAKLIVAAVVLVACAAQATAGAAVADGRLTGSTQITFGCPGPVRADAPACKNWLSFARARFTVTRLTTVGTPIGGAKRVVVSDGRGRFNLALAAGRYQLTPLPQAHTRGGNPTIVTIRAGRAIWALVRYQGFPQMV